MLNEKVTARTDISGVFNSHSCRILSFWGRIGIFFNQDKKPVGQI